MNANDGVTPNIPAVTSRESWDITTNLRTTGKVVVHTTNPDHLIPSAGTPSDRPPLQVALRYRDDESIVRHRADAARKKTDYDPAKKWAHLSELQRQREVEAAGRAAVLDV